jgi:hypothetical protein
MKSKWLAFILSLAFILLAGCQKFSWKDFSSAEGKFSVLMPGTPQNHSQSLNSPFGPVTTYAFVYSNNDSAFAVSYTDYPQDPTRGINTQKVLDGARNSLLAKPGGTLIGESSISLGSYPGREVQMVTAEGDGKHALRTRVYLVNSRLYQVMVVLPNEEASSENAVKFLDSFKLQ